MAKSEDINKTEFGHLKFEEEEDQEICEIWKDFDQWINNHFDSSIIVINPNPCNRNNSNNNNIPVHSLTSLDGKLDDVESGIVCDSLPHSSICTLCQKGSSNATSESQRKSSSRHHYRIANKERSRQPNVITIKPCFEGIFIVVSVSFVLIVFLLWLSRFLNFGFVNIIDRSTPNTVLNWWSPVPNGRSK